MQELFKGIFKTPVQGRRNAVGDAFIKSQPAFPCEYDEKHQTGY